MTVVSFSNRLKYFNSITVDDRALCRNYASEAYESLHIANVRSYLFATKLCVNNYGYFNFVLIEICVLIREVNVTAEHECVYVDDTDVNIRRLCQPCYAKMKIIAVSAVNCGSPRAIICVSSRTRAINGDGSK